MGIKRALNRAHQIHLDQAFSQRNFFALHLSQAVFGADAASQLVEQSIDDAVGRARLLCRGCAAGKGKVVMQITIAPNGRNKRALRPEKRRVTPYRNAL